MGMFFRKKDVNTEEPADFILFGSEDIDESVSSNEADTTPLSENAEDFDDTASLDTSAVLSELEKQNKKSFFSDSANKFSGSVAAFVRKKKILSATIAAILVLAIVTSAAFGIMALANPLRGYAQVAAAKENISYTFDVDGTLALGNKHNITSLVSGKIIGSKFGVGDEVKAGDELYKLDDTEAKLAVEKAKNELNKTSDASYGVTVARIVSTEAGVVQSLTIKEGSIVSPGTKVGTIKKSDGTVSSIIAYMSGKVTVVSVRTGQSLSSGQVVASVNTTNSNEYSAEYDKKSSEIDLQSAQRHLENYSIKSPVSGIIVEKNINVGDNVGITDSERPMMIIVDTSTLNFTFKVDEYRLREMRKGQSVTISVDSFPDTTFSGEVSAISNEGKPDENGVLLFDVTVTIQKPGDLKAGMSVKATVTLASVKNAICVPEDALMESDGQNALVFVKNEAVDGTDDVDLTESLENELEYPHIRIPDGCLLIKVKYGLSNGTQTQILSGLKIGEIVVYNPKTDNHFVKTSMDIDEFRDKDKSNTKIKTNTNNPETESSSDATDSSDNTDSGSMTNDKGATENENNEEIEHQLENEIEKILGQQNSL